MMPNYTFKEFILNFQSFDKYHILDSFSAGGIVIAITQFLEGTIKYVGWALTVVLFLRALYGLYKDRLDVKKQKLELKRLEKQLKHEKDLEMDSAL
jgi:hypothetical protein